MFDTNGTLNTLGVTKGEYNGITPLPKTVVTAMAYIPFQTDTTRYRPETALEQGTLFTDLNKPFEGGKR